MVDQQLREAPVRALVALALLIAIWGALYWVLDVVLRQVGRYELIAIVAQQQIFIHFFLVLAVMLGFSNAILAYSALFGRDEAGHLLALPLPPRQAVCLKWLEGMLLSSWSFLLLGVPLMLAVARNTTVAWYYYPLFVGHFLGFIVIPATIGLLVAWAVAMWAPQRPLAVAAWCGALILTVVGFWAWNAFRTAGPSDQWLDEFYSQISVVRQPWLPTTWSAKGVFAAIQERADVSLFYLFVVVGNAAFLSWLTINVIGASWARAYSHARQGRARALIQDGAFTAALCAVFFFYLPRRMRVVMLKDVRHFARDPMQWTQMVIMIGLLIIYAINLKRLPIDLEDPRLRVLVAFLNLLTVSLILATFTSRFVFPLLSLESQQLWLMGLVPLSRFSLLWIKFLFSITVTGLSALLVMFLAMKALELPRGWVLSQLGVSLGICIGLSGLSVGLGARFPIMGERNPARIASGFGGTFNLIASMIFVAIELGALAAGGLFRVGQRLTDLREVQTSAWLVGALILLGVVVAAGSLWVGGRHFRRMDA